MFPTSSFVLRQLVHLDRDDFVKYVVCPKCSSNALNPGDCTQRVGGRIIAKCCIHKAFKKGKGSKECGTKLAQKVVLSDGKEHFYPLKVYCFNIVINQIEAMLKKPSFPEKCKLWHQRKVSDGVYGDVYNGQVWKDFLTFNGKDFLNASRSLAFALNVDWFRTQEEAMCLLESSTWRYLACEYSRLSFAPATTCETRRKTSAIHGQKFHIDDVNLS